MDNSEFRNRRLQFVTGMPVLRNRIFKRPQIKNETSSRSSNELLVENITFASEYSKFDS